MLPTCQVSANSFKFYLLVLDYDVVYIKSYKRALPQPLLIYINDLIKFEDELSTSLFSIFEKWIKYRNIHR